MISNNNPSAWLRACIEMESEGAVCGQQTQLNPGAIIAEFADPRDAALFRGLKGPSTHCVTAGIYHLFAVRRLVKE